ncbi:MAG: hypothetical protein NVV59_17795 [Chitinophagaceae bacterium]|nr:hypothetical protein [Chitinophagaceae bacterium]
MVYDFDLVSGKVNQVSYQPGQADAYYHRYSYDGENRLTYVYSARDSVMLLLFPERDARYSYYKHGPMARTELGQLRVQGMDHAYTLQGWLKAVNPAMGGTLTNGTDTTEASPVAQDAYAFSLHYYRGDYKSIHYTPQGTTLLGALSSNAAPLYNGNIAAMVVNLPKLGATKLYNYKYDQLNCIVAMDMYNGLEPASGTFVAVNDTSYKERVTYDPNGNILTYWRNGDVVRPVMDRLSYFYKANTNQLHKVTDAATDAGGGTYSQYNDLKQGQADNNYQYDAIGNMVRDNSESITDITWNVYGKIASITKSGAVIRYVYDAAGNRIMKQTAADTTVYVRDASGNVMSVYTRPAAGTLQQVEKHIYGSSRLGIASQHTIPDTTMLLATGFGYARKSVFIRGAKIFELSNHLGNVLVTVTDRRQQVSAGGVNVDSYQADVVNANDYYPFGMQMPGRKYNSEEYRYGFNGKEKDIDISSLTAYDYGFRIYNPGIARFLSVDPLTGSYPFYTPYQFAGNKPTACIDLDGAEEALPPKDKFINVFLFPSKSSMQDFSDHGNAAMAPGYKQALDQNLAGNAIFPIIAETPESAYNQIFDLKSKGYILNNLVIDSHGDNGKSFAIGNVTFDATAAGTAPILQDITKDMVGTIVLLGCEVGMNRQLITGLANHTGRSVYANKAWSTDWFGMFNDETTSRKMITGIVEFLYKNSKEFKKEVDDSHGWLGRLLYNENGRIRNTVDKIYAEGISPSGTADFWAEDYHPDANHGYWGAPTKRLLYEGRVGVWVTSEGGGYSTLVPGSLKFDKHGNISFTSKPFSQTVWGRILQRVVEARHSTTINPKTND